MPLRFWLVPEGQPFVAETAVAPSGHRIGARTVCVGATKDRVVAVILRQSRTFFKARVHVTKIFGRCVHRYDCFRYGPGALVCALVCSEACSNRVALCNREGATKGL